MSNKVTSEILQETPVRRAAVLGGLGYIALFILAVFANFMVREGMVVSGDAEKTAMNIAASTGLFRAGMISFLLVFLIDVLVAWALYILFRETHRDLALVSAWFRLVYTIFMGVALVFFYQALQFLGGAEFLNVFNQDQLHASALVALDSFNSTWLIGLSAFGVHLIFMGNLLHRFKKAPRILGWILIVAGASYVIDTVAHTLLPQYSQWAWLFTAIVAVPSILAEGWFGLWLLVRGGRKAS